MGRYHHLSIEEREDIMRMGRGHKSLADIAAAIGRDKSTVSRELSRNGWSCDGGARAYRAPTAQAGYGGRRLSCVRPKRPGDPRLRGLVQSKIDGWQWSPRQVAGRLRLEEPSDYVPRATIHRAVNAREPGGF